MRGVIVALALSAAAGAQTMAPDLRAQARRVDAIVARHMEALRLVRQFDDSVTRSMGRYETLSIGVMRVLVEPGLRDLVEPATRRASARFASRVGALADRIATERFVVAPYYGSYESGSLSRLLQAGLDRPSTRNRMDQVVSRDTLALAQFFEHTATALVSATIDVSMRNWSGGALMPDTMTTIEWLRRRVELVSAPSSIVRQCYAGDVRACARMFGLEPVADPATEYYDAEDRVTWVRNHVAASRGPGTPAAAECLAGADSACIGVIRGQVVPGTHSPVPNANRHGLASVAIQLGGERGYERLVTATGTPAQRLAAAAGVPLDSLVRAWRHKVRTTRAPSEALSLPIAAASLFWIGICAGLSLRSSRWR